MDTTMNHRGRTVWFRTYQDLLEKWWAMRPTMPSGVPPKEFETFLTAHRVWKSMEPVFGESRISMRGEVRPGVITQVAG